MNSQKPATRGTRGLCGLRVCTKKKVIFYFFQ